MLKPSYAATLLTDQTFQLGDRVGFVQDSGTVPIAAKGTVVGVDRLEIEVVFDDMFISGMDLGGRCSMYRGMTVRRQSILNLSNPQCNQKNSSTASADSSRFEESSYSTESPRPRPRPVTIIHRPDLQNPPANELPRGWEIMGVPPAPDPRPRNGGPRPPRANNRPVNYQQPARPNVDQTNMNQSLGFRPRPRINPRASDQTDLEIPSASHENVDALLLSLLKNNASQENGDPGNGNGVFSPAFPQGDLILPDEGTTAADLLACLRATPSSQQRLHHQQHQQHQQHQPHQNHHQNHQAVWRGDSHIQAQHGRGNGHQHGGQTQRGGGGVHRQPRPPQANAFNGPPHQGGNHTGPRPGGGPAHRVHRGGQHGQQQRPRPAASGTEPVEAAPAHTDAPKKVNSKGKENANPNANANTNAKADANADTNTNTNEDTESKAGPSNGNGNANERPAKRAPARGGRKKNKQQQQQAEGTTAAETTGAASAPVSTSNEGPTLNPVSAPSPAPASTLAAAPVAEAASV